MTNIRGNCPQCKKRDFFTSLEYGRSKCFACGYERTEETKYEGTMLNVYASKSGEGDSGVLRMVVEACLPMTAKLYGDGLRLEITINGQIESDDFIKAMVQLAKEQGIK